MIFPPPLQTWIVKPLQALRDLGEKNIIKSLKSTFCRQTGKILASLDFANWELVPETGDVFPASWIKSKFSSSEGFILVRDA